MKKGGLFLTFEGTDGVGKTTQIKLAAQWLTSLKYRVLLTREPGGSPLSEKIRKLLLDPDEAITPRTELFLYEAARVEHIEKVVRPALEKGFVVLCDRFTDATMAYQGYARGLNKKMISTLNQIATQNLSPRLTIWLDRPPRIALQKAQGRGRQGGDRIEREGLNFQKKVRRGYAAAHKSSPNRVKRIPVQENPSHTHILIQKAIRRVLP